ncbi:MAG: choice-of-anchor Q domain-containing protein [Dokdonella sp.]
MATFLDRSNRRGLGFALLLAGACAPACATTITVTSTADSGAGSLRQALADAVAGNTIDFNLAYPAVIHPQLMLFVTKSLTIEGPGTGNLTIDGNNSPDPMLEIVNSSVVTISDLTVEHAGDTALYVQQGTLTVNHCRLANNLGGAIVSGGTLTVNDSVFDTNHSSSGGGAIFNNAGASINTSSFIGNSSDSGGGAIYNGGGISIHTSTFSGNQAVASNSSRGGAIQNNGDMSIDNSTFAGNSAAGFGGAIQLDHAATVTSSTFSGNYSALGGSGVNTFATLTVSRSILEGCNGTVISSGDNIGTDGSCFADSIVLNDRGNVAPRLAPLADNGGPTKTMALQSASPAIDQVIVNAAGCSGSDQRGVARPVGPRCDIGAYERDGDMLFDDGFD